MSEEKRKDEEKEIVPWYPSDMFRAFDEMWRDFRRDYWGPKGRRLFGPRWGISPREDVRVPLVDLADEGDHYVINAEVPGLSKEDIKIEITDNAIEISGRAEKEHREERDKYKVYERSYSSIHRRLEFPDEVKPEETSASLSNGVLTIKVPKEKLEQKERKHTVNIR